MDTKKKKKIQLSRKQKFHFIRAIKEKRANKIFVEFFFQEKSCFYISLFSRFPCKNKSWF